MIYGVFGGEYSDWYIVGYFDTEEKAKAFCDEYNSNLKWGDEYYILPMKNLEEGRCETPRKWYSVNIDDGETYPVTWDDGWDETEGIYVSPLNDVYIFIYPWQRPKAAKIARDKFAEYKARKAGIV